ncbi:MarR family winged helix-turn-helix transcriptional regulator [Desulfovibrio inopinatus]|uniref:MarR family winged helix-turn-helix transcriptional regulator n=1 Tax=Desulfovibrio inopinatus TaxID=102109 RepID=UPI0009FF1978|nr:MarR family transcriptional regulator [Desulfovibrio inopinatus]
MNNDAIYSSPPLGYLLYRCFRAVTNDLAHRFEAHGCPITVEQWRVLAVLRLRNGQTQNELSLFLGQEKTGVSRLIRALEKKGYIYRKSEEADRRVRRVFLTKKARTQEDEFLQLAIQTLDVARTGLNDEDLSQFKGYLTTVITNLEGNNGE